MDSSNIKESKLEVQPTLAASQAQPTLVASQAQPTLAAPQAQPTLADPQAQPTLAAPQAQPRMMVPRQTVGVMVQQEPSAGRYMYSVFHTIMSLVAIYLSFRCNKGFDAGAFLMACCCPYIYVIYVLATKGTCGVLTNEPESK